MPSILPAAARFDPAEVWALVERWRVTNAFTVPTILKLLVEHPSARLHDHSSLRHVIYAGAPMYRADQLRALEVLGPVIVQYFGLGEVTGNITVLPAGSISPMTGCASEVAALPAPGWRCRSRTRRAARSARWRRARSA